MNIGTSGDNVTAAYPRIAQSEGDYALLDTGDGMKLERYGAYTLARPDPQVIWSKAHPEAWVNADASYKRDTGHGGKFGGVWQKSPAVPSEWRVAYGGNTFIVRPTSFKHTGIFPEQAVHWAYIKSNVENRKDLENESFRFLNLFGYTGGASLAAARAGAEVTHVDASKVANTWAKENAKVSGLDDKSIRYITDDVLQFVKREVRRGNTYQGIVMDPPAFGRGTKSEIWKIEEHLEELVRECVKLLAPDASFLLMSGYAAGYSPLGFANCMQDISAAHGGAITCGEMGIRESDSSRILPTGMYAKWER
jgi:23S rRNA (cytosine1962-C5)-methyltransferase